MLRVVCLVLMRPAENLYRSLSSDRQCDHDLGLARGGMCPQSQLGAVEHQCTRGTSALPVPVYFVNQLGAVEHQCARGTSALPGPVYLVNHSWVQSSTSALVALRPCPGRYTSSISFCCRDSVPSLNVGAPVQSNSMPPGDVEH